VNVRYSAADVKEVA